MRSMMVAEPRRARAAAVFFLFFGATLAAVAVLLTGEGALDVSLRALNPLLLVAGVGFALLVLRFSAAGLPLLIALVYLNLSQALVRYHEFPSLLQLLVVVLAFAAWLRRDTVPVYDLVRDPLAVALLASVLYAFVTTAFAADRAVADGRVVELTKALVIYALVTLLVRDRRRLIQALAALIASAAFLSALPILQTLTGNFNWRFGGLARIKQAHIYGNVFEARIAGPIGDPNFFAQVLLLVLPLPLVMAAAFESRRKRLACFGAAAVILAAVLLTYSRGAMLALAVMAVLLIRVLHIGRRTTAGVAAAGLALILLLPAAVTERFLTIEQILPTANAPLRPDSSFEERRLLMQVAWVMFADNPIRGAGAGNYTARYDDYVDETGSEARQYAGASDLYFPHNLLLEIAAETGLFGLVLFATVIVAAFAALAGAHGRLAAAGDHFLQRATMGVMIGLIGFLVAGLFLHLAFPRYLFLFLALSTAIRRVAAPRPERAEGKTAAVPDEAIEAAGAFVPSARPPVAVLMSRFPLITETFILREIAELERQGQPIVLVPMIEEHPAVVHQEAVPWRDRAIHTPWLSGEVARAFLAALARRPATILGLIGWIIGDALLRPPTLFKSLALLPKSVYLASILPAQGVAHLHAHFATHPATMALIISRLSGIPFSFTVHAHDIFVDRSLLRRKIREAAFIRSISRFNQLFLERLYPADAGGKIAAVHMGIDPSYYDRQTPEASADGRPTILAVAALKPYKGLVYLIRAASLLAAEGIDFRAEIIGAGPLEANLRAEIARCGAGDRVVLRGALPQDEVAAAIATCDLFVQPSIIAADGQMEGIPVALMEAMAARRPVIATALSGVPELVEDRVSGLLVDPANPETLAAAMREILGSPELRSRLGAAGRAKVEREFSIRETVEALGRLLDRHNPPLPLEELRPAAAAIPDARFGLRRLHRRADSRVVELLASTPGGTVEIIVKQHLSRRGESRPAAERAAGEYAMLRTLHGALHGKSHDGRTLGVPAPIAHDAGSATIVTERAHGTPMDAMIRRARRDRAASDTLVAAARAAGAWLRELQRSAPPREGRHAIEDVLRRGERDARLAGLSRRKARNARRTMEALAGELFARGRIAVPHHGDFWPGNVFVDAQRVEVIDFEGFRFGLPAEDLAYFLVHARLYLAFRRPELMGIVERGLLSGYGGEVDERELRLARLGCALQLLARSRSGASFLHEALRRAILRKELAR